MYEQSRGGAEPSREDPKKNGQTPRKEQTMSTRSAIGVRLPDSTIQAVYCHNDGYPEYTGSILCHRYTAPQRIKALIALGALSILGEKLKPAPGAPHTFGNPQPNVTIAYHRDRNEPMQPAVSFATIEDYVTKAKEDFCADYLYLFEDGGWKVYAVYGDRKWTALDAVVAGRN